MYRKDKAHDLLQLASFNCNIAIHFFSFLIFSCIFCLATHNICNIETNNKKRHPHTNMQLTQCCLPFYIRIHYYTNKTKWFRNGISSTVCLNTKLPNLDEQSIPNRGRRQKNIANSQFSCYCDKGTNYRYVEQPLLIQDDDIPIVFQALGFPQRFS